MPKPQDNEIVPFDPFTLENENFNLQSSNHVNDEYQSLFVDYYYQSSDKQHQHPLPLLRPVYNLLNIYLYLPASLVDLSAFTHADGYATFDSKRYLKVVPASEVPQSVQRGLKYYPQ